MDWTPTAAGASSSSSTSQKQVVPEPSHKVFRDSFDGLQFQSSKPHKTIDLNPADNKLLREHERLARFEGKAHSRLAPSDKKNLFATSFGVIASEQMHHNSGPGKKIGLDKAETRRLYHPKIHDMTNDGRTIATSGTKSFSKGEGPRGRAAKRNPIKYEGVDFLPDDDATVQDIKLGRNRMRNALMAGAPDDSSEDSRKPQYSAPSKPVSFTTTFDHSEHADWARLDSTRIANSIAADPSIVDGAKIYAVTYNGHTTRYTCRNCEQGMHNLCRDSSILRDSLSQSLVDRGFAVPKGGVRLIPIISAHEWTNAVSRPNSNPPHTRTDTTVKDSATGKSQKQSTFDLDRAALGRGVLDVKKLADEGKFVEVPLFVDKK